MPVSLLFTETSVMFVSDGVLPGSKVVLGQRSPKVMGLEDPKRLAN